MDNIKYSVLMSVYYKEKAENLEYSINSIVNQTIAPSEIVIIEDGPLGKELDIVLENFSNKYLNLFKIIKNEKNMGLGLSLNRGVKECSNELIIRMDSDDYSVENRCEKLLKFINDNPEYDCVGSLEAEFEENINNVVAIHKVPENDYEIKKFMRRRCALLHPTVLFKKSAVISVGNYRDIKLYEDYDLFIRMVCQKKCKCYNIQEPLYYIRINDDFFKRRGGWKYMLTVVKFKNKQRKLGYISIIDFCISAGGQAFICLMPNCIRRWFYLKFLR